MIKKFNNWDNVQTFGDRPKLPAGGYVCTIKKAEVVNTSWGDQLHIYIDIIDGSYAYYFTTEFNNNNAADKKWKGILRLWLPNDDNSDKDEKTKSVLKGFITSVEKSNKGYTWNWEEKSLAGKEIGIIFRNEEWEWKGKRGWTVRPFRASSVDSIQDSSYTVPDDKPLKNKSSESFTSSYASADDEELPF